MLNNVGKTQQPCPIPLFDAISLVKFPLKSTIISNILLGDSHTKLLTIFFYLHPGGLDATPQIYKSPHF